MAYSLLYHGIITMIEKNYFRKWLLFNTEIKVLNSRKAKIIHKCDYSKFIEKRKEAKK
jgi:hypothetical protein